MQIMGCAPITGDKVRKGLGDRKQALCVSYFRQPWLSGYRGSSSDQKIRLVPYPCSQPLVCGFLTPKLDLTALLPMHDCLEIEKMCQTL